MDQKIRHENDYNQNLCIDCPYCGKDRPDHSCQNCSSEMDKEVCWKLGGFCSKKCLKHIKEELPKLRKQKEEMGIKCKCDESLCGKCLGSNCQDKNCPTHTSENKEAWRSRWEGAHKKPFPHPKNY